MIKYFLAVALSLHCVCAYAESRPNVLWIYLEDISGWLSCYGETLIETPNFDRLAARGIRFDRFYTPAGVCSATRSATIVGACRQALAFTTTAVDDQIFVVRPWVLPLMTSDCLQALNLFQF